MEFTSFTGDYLRSNSLLFSDSYSNHCPPPKKKEVQQKKQHVKIIHERLAAFWFFWGGFCFCWNPLNKNALRSKKHISSKPLRIRFGSMEVLESTIIIKTWILVMKTMSWLSWAQSSFLGFWIQPTSISVGKTTFWGAPIRWKNVSFSKENSFFQWNWGKKLKNSSISYHLFLGPFSWLDSSLLVFIVAEFFLWLTTNWRNGLSFSGRWSVTCYEDFFFAKITIYNTIVENRGLLPATLLSLIFCVWQ